MRRSLLWVVVILTALLLQSTVFAQITLAGAKPDLVYLVTIAMAMLEGPAVGAVTGFAGGMAEDFLLNQPKGITALTLTLLGYAVGMLRQYIVTPSALLPVINTVSTPPCTAALGFPGMFTDAYGSPQWSGQAQGQIDDDATLDLWTISTVYRVAAVGRTWCDSPGAENPAGEPLVETNDVIR